MVINGLTAVPTTWAGADAFLISASLEGDYSFKKELILLFLRLVVCCFSLTAAI
jgi:hypothetical protein